MLNSCCGLANYFFFFLAFLAPFLALRFFAMQDTSFLDQILHAHCNLSKEFFQFHGAPRGSWFRLKSFAGYGKRSDFSNGRAPRRFKPLGILSRCFARVDGVRAPSHPSKNAP